MVSLWRVGLGLSALAVTGAALTGGCLTIRRRNIRSSGGVDGHSDLSTAAVNSVKGPWVPHTDPMWAVLYAQGHSVEWVGDTVQISPLIGLWRSLDSDKRPSPSAVLAIDVKDKNLFEVQKAIFEALAQQAAKPLLFCTLGCKGRVVGDMRSVDVKAPMEGDSQIALLKELRVAFVKAEIANRADSGEWDCPGIAELYWGYLRLELELARIERDFPEVKMEVTHRALDHAEVVFKGCQKFVSFSQWLGDSRVGLFPNSFPVPKPSLSWVQEGSWTARRDPLWDQLNKQGCISIVFGQEFCLFLEGVPDGGDEFKIPVVKVTVDAPSQGALYDSLLNQLLIAEQTLSQDSPNQEICFWAHRHACEVTVGSITASDTLEQAQRKIWLAVIKAAVAGVATAYHSSTEPTNLLEQLLGRLRLKLEVARLQLDDPQCVKLYWQTDRLAVGNQTFFYQSIGMAGDFDLSTYLKNSS